LKTLRTIGFLIMLAAASSYPCLFALQPSEVKFEHLTVNDGLSENAVTLVMQDRSGTIWIGTHDGLNKYDGYDFTIYRNIPGDKNSLSDNAIGALCEDAQGNIWIGTIGSGLNRFNPFAETCTRYVHDQSDPQSLGNDVVLRLFADGKGRIWISVGSGIDRFDPQSQGFIHVFPKAGTLFEDPSGKIWLAVACGDLYAYDEANKSFVHFVNPRPFKGNKDGGVGWHYLRRSNVLLAVKENAIFRYDLAGGKWLDGGEAVLLPPDVKTIAWAVESDSGGMWIGTHGHGLFEIGLPGVPVRHWLHSAGDPSSLSNNIIYHVFKDRSGIIWISTEGGGVDLIKNSKLKFPHYRHVVGNNGSISGNYVTSIFKDTLGILWLGTGGAGLNRIDEEENHYYLYKHDAGRPASSLSHDYITSITPDPDPEFLWIGTASGLNRLRKATGAFTVYMHDEKNPHSLVHDEIGNTFGDSRGDLWVTANVYLDRLPAGKREFIHYRHDPAVPGSISEGPGYPIYEDRDGVIWIGSWKGGLNRYNRAGDDFSHFAHDERDPQSLSHDRVWAILEDSHGRLWVGTWGGGLNLFDRKSGTFKRYDQRDGLASNVIYGILEDDEGSLWMSTNRGLSCFDPGTESFRNFDVDDGLQGNEFNTRAFFKDMAGRMYFGGINGYNAFHPAQIVSNPHVPPVVITSFRIADREIRYDKPIQTMGEIKLAHNQNFLSFVFAALDFNCPKKNRYRYILEGLEKNWNSVDARQRFADYKDLDPGRYVFRIRGSNNDGVWNEQGVAVRLSITPPFWGTWWFRALALMIFGYISYLFIAFIRGHFRLIHFWKSKSIIGKYRILEKIASGGMGIVYKGASLTDKSKVVALKALREEQALSEVQRRRFINEGRIVDSLNHPHIVRIHERACQGQDLFIVMEYLEGATLEDKIRRQGILPAPEALGIMKQLAETVAALHERGVIHRDLKPGNIMLTRRDGTDNFVKLLDFGVSRTEGMTRLTKSGMIIGTVGFVPPEQVSSAEFGFPGDIYSLGVIFYEMATGDLPFVGESTLEVMKQILNEEPIPPATVNPDLGKDLNDMILKMMGKNPARRPTAGELLDFFRRAS
jgi:ligand-binding sensor domain-containing protein/tRNA A-37 threonylcarbamoyl transferase component Bud32